MAQDIFLNEATTAATTITTDNTSTALWTYGDQYTKLNVDAYGALNVRCVPNEEVYAKPKPKRFIEKLRQEIGDWHGNILEKAA